MSDTRVRTVRLPKNIVPCPGECGNKVTHPNLGVCNDCWHAAWLVFRAAMNWPV